MGSTAVRKKLELGDNDVHSLVDDHSRLAYGEILPDAQGPTRAAFLERAITYFAVHDIPRIERLMTDNPFAYRYSLRSVCAVHSIKQKFITPRCPWRTARSSASTRALTTGWAYRQAFTTNDERAAALAPWLERYNTERRHGALGGTPPISRLLPT